ncbi:unnamed protein product [Notodromas monacha]|uniref:Cleavage stimulation factor 50 kDa subunit n=1 Tax=Notodromas monacha TaxID=399045 RepID=A0A7R9GH55_9CRUS|nr:unnamed protein product [Notodromas monacha]CAG0920564.1 unnamed protein product [Notodromas monacha]
MRFRCKITDEVAVKNFSGIIHFVSRLWRTVTLRLTANRMYLAHPAGLIDGSPELHVIIERHVIFSLYNLDGLSDDHPEIFLSLETAAFERVLSTVRGSQFSTLRSIKMQLTNKGGACLTLDLELECKKTGMVRNMIHDIPVDVIPLNEWNGVPTPVPMEFSAIFSLPSSPLVSNLFSFLKGNTHGVNMVVQHIQSKHGVKGTFRFTVNADMYSIALNMFELDVPPQSIVPLVSNYDEIARGRSTDANITNNFTATVKFKKMSSLLSVLDNSKSKQEPIAMGMFFELPKNRIRFVKMTKSKKNKDLVPPEKDPIEEALDPENIVKCRDLLYRLMVGQLFYDGQSQIAIKMSNLIQADPPCTPSDRLIYLLQLGLMKERENDKAKSSSNAIASQIGGKATIDAIPGLDLEFQSDVPSSAPEPALYETAYVTAHKGMCRAGAFSPDGVLCATGSVDASIKVMYSNRDAFNIHFCIHAVRQILDVERMLAKSAPELLEASSSTIRDGRDGQETSFLGHPVIRTLYDHMEEVTTLQFHPKLQILASGSRDHTVKLFDFSKTSTKKAFRTLTHPQPKCYLKKALRKTISLFWTGRRANMLQAWPVTKHSSISSHHHTGPVLSVKFSADGRQFVTCSRDGSIKIWDAVSNRNINTFAKAHEGALQPRHLKSFLPFHYGRFRKYKNRADLFNDFCKILCTHFFFRFQYVLSSGKDSLVKLWELTSSRCLIAYTGAGTTGELLFSSEYVLSSGKDSLVKLWELTSSRCLIAYTGAGTTGKQEHAAQAVFNHTEDFVMYPDEATVSLCCWDARNAARKQLLSLGHNGAVRYICHSPCTPAFLTCSEDFRARFWYKRTASAAH